MIAAEKAAANGILANGWSGIGKDAGVKTLDRPSSRVKSIIFKSLGLLAGASEKVFLPIIKV